MTIPDLIAKLRAATEPCRELDAEIAARIGLTVAKAPNASHFVCKPEGETYSWQRVPEYTASIDAALGLFEDERDALSILWRIRVNNVGWPTTFFELCRELCIDALEARMK